MLEQAAIPLFKSCLKIKTPTVFCLEKNYEPKNLRIIALMEKLGKEFNKVLCYKLPWKEYIRYYPTETPNSYHQIIFLKDRSIWFTKEDISEKDLKQYFEYLMMLYHSKKYYSGYAKVLSKRKPSVYSSEIDIFKFERQKSQINPKGYFPSLNLSYRRYTFTLSRYHSPHYPENKIVYSDMPISKVKQLQSIGQILGENKFNNNTASNSISKSLNKIKESEIIFKEQKLYKDFNLKSYMETKSKKTNNISETFHNVSSFNNSFSDSNMKFEKNKNRLHEPYKIKSLSQLNRQNNIQKNSEISTLSYIQMGIVLIILENINNQEYSRFKNIQTSNEKSNISNENQISSSCVQQYQNRNELQANTSQIENNNLSIWRPYSL